MTTRLQQAHHYLNLVRDKGLREFGWAYLAWLRNGGVGKEPPVRGTRRAGVRARLLEILGPAPFEAAKAT